MLFSNIQEDENNFQQHGVPYYLLKTNYYSMKFFTMLSKVVISGLFLFCFACTEEPVQKDLITIRLKTLNFYSVKL